MRLTNSIRSAYVRSVLHDVPKIDFASKIIDLTMKVIREGTPENILALYDSVSAKPYMKLEFVTVSCRVKSEEKKFGNGQFASIQSYIPVPMNLRFEAASAHYGSSATLEVSKLSNAGLQGQLKELCLEAHETAEARRKAETTLNSLANSCTTVKALAEAAPEFAKYLPSEVGNTLNRSVPALRDVVSTVRAAGWAPPLTRNAPRT